jgi:hypothetical protein
MDRMLDEQDRRDRAELMRAAGRQAIIDAAWEEKRATEQARREELERRSTTHKGVGDPDFNLSGTGGDANPRNQPGGVLK